MEGDTDHLSSVPRWYHLVSSGWGSSLNSVAAFYSPVNLKFPLKSNVKLIFYTALSNPHIQGTNIEKYFMARTRSASLHVASFKDQKLFGLVDETVQ